MSATGNAFRAALVAKLGAVTSVLALASGPIAPGLFAGDAAQSSELAAATSRLPAWTKPASPPGADWFIDASGFKAGVFRGATTN